ncbi:carbon-nitrogen hydrolase family protein [Paenarthrobacter sp. NPDC057981]|uniref:carbon-nitrogen hydrolase family protein n=1 Tax=Paenarthrobacter sp. NPDC057981 TaxID=3346297 RepID=UPI0036DB4CE0
MSEYSAKPRVAVVQAAPVWLDLDGTIDKTVALIEEAGRGGANLIAFPECWVPGYPEFLYTETNTIWPGMYLKRYYENSLELDSSQMRRVQRAAQESGVAVVLGLSERSGGSLYISQAVIGADGTLQGLRRKFRPTHAERTLFGEGDGSDFRTFDLGIGRVGALSCWEHLQPLIKYTMNALGEQIHVASWPAVTKPYHYPFSGAAFETINNMYAMENQCFVLCSTLIFDEAARDNIADTDAKRDIVFPGGGVSRIYGPSGIELATPLAPDQEGLLYADLDLSDIIAAKNTIDQVGHYSRPGIFSLNVNQASPRPVTFTNTDQLSHGRQFPWPLEDEETLLNLDARFAEGQR